MADQPKSDAEVFYDQTAEPMKYHATAHRVIEQDALSNLSTPESARAAADSWMPMLARYQIGDSNDFAEAIAEASRSKPTPEKVTQWRAQSKAALQSEYGDMAGAALRDAQMLIANDKTLRTFLEKTGAGDHPRVIREIAASAARARKAGKL